MHLYKEKIQSHFREHMAVVERCLELEEANILLLSDMILSTLEQGGKILWMGNGGSAADCQHLAAEFVGRFQKERIPLPSLALTVDTSLLTAVGNDYGFDEVFSRQVQALASKKDLVIGISTSGNSKNVLKALEQAKRIGAKTAGFTGGSAGQMPGLCDALICVPAKNVARIQEAHILIGHILCDLVDERWISDAPVAQ